MKSWWRRRKEATAMAVQVDEADAVSRAELVEYLANICAFAKRQPAVTAKLTTDPPTAYDKAHRLMDGPLDELLSR